LLRVVDFSENDMPESGWVLAVMEQGMLKVERVEAWLEGAVLDEEEILHVDPGS